MSVSVHGRARQRRVFGYLVTITWNYPTWAFTVMTWRWSDDGRRCWRLRVGWLKAQGQHPSCMEATS